MKETPQKLSLQQRLAQLVGKRVEITAKDLSLEPGLLQKVFRQNFIRVTGELFVPLSLNTMTFFNLRRSTRFKKVGITTSFDNPFTQVELVRIGKDYVEIQLPKSNRRILIPLNKVIRIFHS